MILRSKNLKNNIQLIKNIITHRAKSAEEI